MNNFFRGIIAAWGAKKLGGGCLSTIVIFIAIYVLLGKCNNNTARAGTVTGKTHKAAHIYFVNSSHNKLMFKQ